MCWMIAYVEDGMPVARRIAELAECGLFSDSVRMLQAGREHPVLEIMPSPNECCCDFFTPEYPCYEDEEPDAAQKEEVSNV